MNKKAHEARTLLIAMMRTHETKNVKETGRKLIAMRNEVKQTLQTGTKPGGKAVTLSEKKELQKRLLYYRSELKQLVASSKIYKAEKRN
ncbi:hypothetical protein [Ectobacillus ponti]|uniref:Uncharacterized protein n=1 Tax=Ectobacillus ponti TaxID=2961894 RepID=A0AA41X8V1_9BACI|nr:hypothetical protein [Ectobacillus ponti]MCP8969258.1 hypothetical protein [Ectobacillus ponti]